MDRRAKGEPNIDSRKACNPHHGDSLATTMRHVGFQLESLKVSPPIPVGRLAGRFKVQIWRASPEHKLNLIVGPGSQSLSLRSICFLQTFHGRRNGNRGDVVVMLDASHLGIYSGDEVLAWCGAELRDVCSKFSGAERQ